MRRRSDEHQRGEAEQQRHQAVEDAEQPEEKIHCGLDEVGEKVFRQPAARSSRSCLHKASCASGNDDSGGCPARRPAGRAARRRPDREPAAGEYPDGPGLAIPCNSHGRRPRPRRCRVGGTPIAGPAVSSRRRLHHASAAAGPSGPAPGGAASPKERRPDDDPREETNDRQTVRSRSRRGPPRPPSTNSAGSRCCAPIGRSTAARPAARRHRPARRRGLRRPPVGDQPDRRRALLWREATYGMPGAAARRLAPGSAVQCGASPRPT